jgi:hypothetical protein
VSTSAVQRKERLAFEPNQLVWHNRFGTGEVIEVSGEEVQVAFARYGQRRVVAAYLRPAAQ